VILRHGTRMAVYPDERGLGGEPQELPQVAADGVLEPGVGPEGLLLLQGAADKGAHEDLAGGSAAGELDAAEGAGDQVAPLDCRHHESHAVQGMGNVDAVACQRDDGR